MENDQFLCAVSLVQMRECGVERERAVELVLGRADAELAAPAGVVTISIGRHRGKAIQCTAKDHEHEARIGVRVGECQSRRARWPCV